MKLYINTDGGSRGNPGHAACAFIAKDENGKEIFKWSKYLGIRTNNQAEYMGVIMALKWLESQRDKMEIEEVNFILDSELVVKQIRGEYKMKSRILKPYLDKVLQLQDKLNFTFTYNHVLRNLNTVADSLVNEAMDANADSRK